MKKIIFLLSIILCANTYAQTKQDSDIAIKYQYFYGNSNTVPAEVNDTTVYNKVSYFTKNQDTLYLLNNELGLKICEVWDTHKYDSTPVILMVDKLPSDAYIKPKTIKAKKI